MALCHVNMQRRNAVKKINVVASSVKLRKMNALSSFRPLRKGIQYMRKSCIYFCDDSNCRKVTLIFIGNDSQSVMYYNRSNYLNYHRESFDDILVTFSLRRKLHHEILLDIITCIVIDNTLRSLLALSGAIITG